MTSKSYLLTRLAQLKKEVSRLDDALSSVEMLTPTQEELSVWRQLELPRELGALLDSRENQRAVENRDAITALTGRKRAFEGGESARKVRSKLTDGPEGNDTLPELPTIEDFLTVREELRKQNSMHFLGDSLVVMIVSELLYRSFPGCSVDELSTMRVKLVGDGRPLNRAQQYDLPMFDDSSTFAEAFQKYVGCLYVDRGYSIATVKSWICALCEPLVQELKQEDAKMSGPQDVLMPQQPSSKQNKVYWKHDPVILTSLNRINELPFTNTKACKEKLYTALNPTFIPDYVVYERTGSDNEPSFKVGVTVNGEVIGTGEARSVKEAGARAAFCAISMNAEKFERYKSLNKGIRELGWVKPAAVTTTVADQVENGIF